MPSSCTSNLRVAFGGIVHIVKEKILSHINTGQTRLDMHNYARIIIYFPHCMVSTNGYMFSWFVHRMIHYMHSTNGYIYIFFIYNGLV